MTSISYIGYLPFLTNNTAATTYLPTYTYYVPNSLYINTTTTYIPTNSVSPLTYAYTYLACQWCKNNYALCNTSIYTADTKFLCSACITLLTPHLKQHKLDRYITPADIYGQYYTENDEMGQTMKHLIANRCPQCSELH